MTRRVWRTIDVEIEVNGLELGSRMSVDGYQLLYIGPAPTLDLVSHAVAADVASVCHQQAQRSTQKVSKQGPPVSSHLPTPLPLIRDRMCAAMSESRNTVAQRFCRPTRCGRRTDE